MPISFLPQLIISILVTIISITNLAHANNHCLHDQKTLLLQLKNDLIFNSSASKKLVKWNQTRDCCSWDGVECDGAGHVIGLQLDDEAISGGLKKSSSLFSLVYLEKLNLANNNFDGIHIPRRIHNLKYLRDLNLSYAGFGGQIPVELSFLRSLVSLDISLNWYIKPLNDYTNLRMLLRNLTGLRELYLDGISISAQGGEWCQTISSSLPDLRILSLSRCNLSGPLDRSLLRIHSLSVLRLDGNNFSTIPDFFSNFSSLITLSLSDCLLHGSFPEMLFKVATLQNLDLSVNMLLNGTIPQFPHSRSFKSISLSFTGFSGSLPESISNLEMLSNIDMQSCGFTGRIPSTLANLTELVHVDLSNNSFTGLIPPFNTFKKLRYIDLSRNSLTGSLSSMHFEGLSDLVYVNLGYNSLNGSIPPSLFRLPSLQKLTLSINQFSGQVDEFPTLHFSNMSELRLDVNQLGGPIPLSFFKLKNLQVLALNHNLFNGTVQLERIRSLRNLMRLELSYNKLTVDGNNSDSSPFTFRHLVNLGIASCNLYSFPELLKQSSVRYLDMSNNRITGEIPSWIWKIGNGKLAYLNLAYNLLVDLQKPYHIPTSLVTLDLHSNQLRGELPLPKGEAKYVDYSNNNFNQTIPYNFVMSDSYLGFLSLANNSISGLIPDSLCNVAIRVIDLSHNNLSGNIPDAFSVGCSLQSFVLANNNLGGKIPTSLENCQSLEFLNVGNNNIDDRFPCMLPASLRVLVLRNNKFHGEVRCNQSWGNLQIIDIASNSFSGNLNPINFSSWRGMMVGNDTLLSPTYNLEAGFYYKTMGVTLTIKQVVMEVNIWTDHASIDFSCNNFHGEIPDAIGDLSSLYLLNVSHNTLRGRIPKSFGNLAKLESLDLSVNQLTGTIPVELARLTFLAFLNLSYNKLVGDIPQGPQFHTFSVDSFEGNTGLCGLPFNISCLSPPKVGNVQSPGKMEIEWEYVSAALGFVVGLGSFLWALFSFHGLRQKYFEKLDQVFDKIF